MLRGCSRRQFTECGPSRALKSKDLPSILAWSQVTELAEERVGRRMMRVWRSEGSRRNRMLGNRSVIRRGEGCKGG